MPKRNIEAFGTNWIVLLAIVATLLAAVAPVKVIYVLLITFATELVIPLKSLLWIECVVAIVFVKLIPVRLFALANKVFWTKSSDFKKIASNSINVHSLIKLDTIGKTISFDADYFNYDNTINRNFSTQNSLSNNSQTINGFKSAENF